MKKRAAHVAIRVPPLRADTLKRELDADCYHQEDLMTHSTYLESPSQRLCAPRLNDQVFDHNLVQNITAEKVDAFDFEMENLNSLLKDFDQPEECSIISNSLE